METSDAHRLVLWDIDLTLVDLRGLGGDWYRRALADIAGVPLRYVPAFPGRTERAITLELLAAHAVEASEETVRRMWQRLVDISTESLPTLAERGRALPGAAAALATMAVRAGVVQTLVTGNLPEIARHKLSAFDLHGHIDFEIGGYGSLSAERAELVAHAMARAAAKHGREFPGTSVVVIGDTPHDVDAALRHGATAIGVATGRHGVAELRDAGAHTVLTDLTETEAVVTAILAERE
ncbi:Phosphoglycolate phosphatase, HAD superfamily [Amycolatopsis arida]|uniref:Phosphoglycolate phosphatase, HAD superfamily n=1 Tax=Amycolatopsis arida TaxID=587909 RepID=A0A1I5KL54_9PSEU|nr:haloacid dehalogenase-like hydrolase [Amycolatopsis arida]TDX97102.1 phosphoglycolate phosphatase-like HAD superfamily hydrolase [Amycolatopsis arida]SFO85788.1 Phosphoglycolate phosphatase, HAD superfamily [Amycolatopsis arida]